MGEDGGGGTLYVAVAVSEQAGATKRTIRVAVERTITGICRAIVAPYGVNLRCYQNVRSSARAQQPLRMTMY